MSKIDEATKLARLERIRLRLTRNARGLTEAEIADELRLERRTVNNCLRELEIHGKALKDGLYWFPLVLKESRLRPFDLSPSFARNGELLGYGFSCRKRSTDLRELRQLLEE